MKRRRRLEFWREGSPAGTHIERLARRGVHLTIRPNGRIKASKKLTAHEWRLLRSLGRTLVSLLQRYACQCVAAEFLALRWPATGATTVKPAPTEGKPVRKHRHFDAIEAGLEHRATKATRTRRPDDVEIAGTDEPLQDKAPGTDRRPQARPRGVVKSCIAAPGPTRPAKDSHGQISGFLLAARKGPGDDQAHDRSHAALDDPHLED